MKKVEELKAGMEVWMKFRVENNESKYYPFVLNNENLSITFTKDCRFINKPLEMYTIDENEIPELKGVEMEVSKMNSNWSKLKVYGKHEKKGYLTSFGWFNNARPIQKTFDLSNVPEHLLTDELKQYLK